MKIDRFDHIVLTVKDVEVSLAFYCDVLGMERHTFADNRKAARFGNQKINFHSADGFSGLVAKTPTCGSADLCFISSTPVAQVIEVLKKNGVAIELGPIER